MRGGVVCAVLGLLAPTVARADNADALVVEARALASQGDMLGAAAKFLAAYAADPRPQLLCNVAIAYHKAGHELPRAQLFFSQCLTRASTLDAAFVSTVRTTLVDVEAKLRAGKFTPIDIVVKPSGATIELAEFLPAEAFVGARLVWVPFGAHTIRIHAEGYIDETVELETHSNEQQSVRVDLQRVPEVVGPPERPPAPRQPMSSPRSRVPGVVTAVAAGGLGLLAGGAYLLANHHAGSAAGLALSGSRGDYDAKVSSVRRWQHLSWGLGIGSVVLAGVSTVLWFRYFEPVSVTPTGDGVMVGLGGSF